MKCFEEHFVLEFKMVEAFSGIGSLRSMARSLQISSLHRMCLVLSSTAAPPPPPPLLKGFIFHHLRKVSI